MKKCKFTGMVNDQNGPHGQGTAVREDGFRYEGTFKDGSLVKGKWFIPSGALWYEGECSGGERHGMGTLFDPHRNVYKGRFERGNFVDGTMTSPEGRVITVVNGECVSGYL